MVLYTKDIYDTTNKTHGLRVFVARELIKDNTIVPHLSLITGKTFDYWAPILAPSREIEDNYKKNGILDEFIERYRLQLREQSASLQVRRWAHEAASGDITLLFRDETPREVRMGVLVEEIKWYESKLKIKHLGETLIL